MGAIRPFVFLLIILSTPARLFILNRRMCPLKNDVCHYYENPNLIALLRDAEKIPTLLSRSPFFFADEEPSRDRIMKNINYDFLDLNHPIRNLDDFMEINSEEIGTLGKNKYFEQKPIPWKMDEMQTYITGPKVLPDVMLSPESPYVQTKPQILSDTEKQLGRFVVDDSPHINGDMIQREKLLTVEAEDMGDDEIDERYLSEPKNNHYPPSIMMNKIVKAPEKHIPKQYMNEYYRHVLVTPSPEDGESTIEKTPTADEEGYNPHYYSNSYVQDPKEPEVYEEPEDHYIEDQPKEVELKYVPNIKEPDPYHPAVPQDHFLQPHHEFVVHEEEEEMIVAPPKHEEENPDSQVLEEPVQPEYVSTTPTPRKSEQCETTISTPKPTEKYETTPSPLESSTCPPPEIQIISTTSVPETNTQSSVSNTKNESSGIECDEKDKVCQKKRKRRKKKKSKNVEIANRAAEADNLFEGLLSVM